MPPFQVNDSVLWRGERTQLAEAVCNGMAAILDPSDRAKVLPVPVSELTIAPLIDLPPVDQINPLQWQKCLAHAKAARAIMAAKTKDERNQLYAAATEELKCSKRSIQRTMADLQRMNSVVGLLPAKSGRRDGTRLLKTDAERIIADRLADTWLAGNRPLLSDVIRLIQAECRKVGLSAPCAGTIRKRAANLDPGLVLCKREGNKVAKYQRKALTGHIEAALLLECVQIDHTLADVVLVSEFNRRVAIGRPWVTFAIDVASRMVVGVYISFDAPSAVSVAMCLANALLPKDEFLESLGLQGTWPCHGIMQRIAMDNGRDFHSEALQRGCSEIGIDIQYRPVGSPHYGGVIERLIGTMMGKCRLLPGATQSNVVARGEYDPEGRAVMTLSAFTAFLVNQIVNVYHLMPHRTLQIPPIKRWEELATEGKKPREMGAGWRAAETRLLFYPYEERLIRRTGVQLWNRTYWSSSLREWVADSKQRPVHYDPADISAVFVRSPNGEIVRAACTRKDASPLSLAEWHFRQKQRRAIGNSPDLVARRDEGILASHALIGAARKAAKRAHRKANNEQEHADRSRMLDAPEATKTPENGVIELDFTRPAQLLPILSAPESCHG